MYLLWWSYAHMSTCVDYHMLLSSHVLILTCFDDHTHTYFNYLTLSCLHALTRPCLLACMPWWLICTNNFIIACSYVHMIYWSHAFMFTCLDDRMLPCQHTLMITSLLPCTPSISYAWILWWLPTPVLKLFFFARSHTLIFTCLIIKHMCTHLDDEMSIGSKAKVIL